MHRTLLTLLAAAAVLAGGIVHAAPPASTSESVSMLAPVIRQGPQYTVEHCCTLCPRAADPQAYAGSKFMNDFRVLIDGRNGWLFRTGLDLTTRFDISDASIVQLRRLAEALRRRGTQIVMVYQPPRGLMDPDELTPAERRAYNFRAARSNYAQALQQLRDGGVIVPPLDQLAKAHKGYDYYFRRDHHWTAAGARHTAKVVAETMRRLPGFSSIPRKKFVTHTDGIIGKPGTLQKVASKLCGGRYSMQYEPVYVTEPVGGGGSLLGNQTQPDVVLVGTSNSDTKGGYDFAGYLEQYLGVDVLDVAITGGSYDGSLLHYLASDAFQKHPPKFMIWETPYQDYPSQNPYKVYRQAVPLVTDGCHDKTPVLQRTVKLHQGTNELLFNGGGRVLPLVGRNYQIEFQFSDPGIKNMHAQIWYYSGLKESLKMHFKQYVDNGGRFDAELRSDQPKYANATLMGVTLLMDEAPKKPLSVTAEVCPRNPSTLTASTASK